MSFLSANTPGSSGLVLDDNLDIRTYKIAHQSVTLDVNIEEHSIKGCTSIILIPLVPKLDYASFDCRGIEVTDVQVEGRRSENYVFDDQQKLLDEKYIYGPLTDTLLRYNSIHQAEFYKEKVGEFSPNPQDENKSQITVKIPSNIKITLQNTGSLANYTPITPSIKGTPGGQEAVFTPITIKIDYVLSNPVSGIVFDTMATDEPQLWNCFTTNSELGCGASNWVPCIDTLDEKCTWELEISVPKTVRDLLNSKALNTKSAGNSRRGSHDGDDKIPLAEDGDDSDGEENLVNEENDQDNPLNRDIVVACSEFSTMKESLHPTDLSKKTYTFQVFNPVSAQFIGWAVGSFDIWTLPQISNKLDIDEDLDEIKTMEDSNGANDDYVPIQIYTLPTYDVDKKVVINSTIISQKFLDFYAKEFGSFPFASYGLVFLPTVSTTILDFAGLSIANTRLLYPHEIIDQIIPTTEELAWSIASQWSGINITPTTLNDYWCCIGMAGFMVLRVLKKIFGNNAYHFKLKMSNEAILREDIGKPPLGNSISDLTSRPISYRGSLFQFMRLKAPMVLHILDRRMTKTERSFGMSRVLPKIFLQAMSGDLANNALSSVHFQHVCEKVNKNKLESFFQQWVYGSGVPILRVTQRYNRKRMMVEMGIRQCQSDPSEFKERVGRVEENFFNRALNSIEAPNFNTTSVFTGSITIRIHDSDGTPYEHIIEIKDTFTKIDIQYNTKYKKSRGKKTNEDEKLNEEREIYNYDQRLGNVLETESECSEWGIVEPGITSGNINGDENQRTSDGSIDWIRIDSDFEWIAKIYINQPDFMFATQLQRDSDVEAQLESVWFYSDVITSNASAKIYVSQLVRTIVDERYYYGVRIEAARALAKFIPQNSFADHYLVLVFRKLFCFEGTNIPKNNDFSNFQNYFVKKAIPEFISSIRDDQGDCPSSIKHFLLDILAYNENADNSFDDTYYIAKLLQCVVSCCMRGDTHFTKKVMEQIQRYDHLEKWVPSYQFVLSSTSIALKTELSMKGLISYESQDFDDLLRLASIRWTGENTMDSVWVNVGLKNMSNTGTSTINFTGKNAFHFREGLQDISVAAMKSLLNSCGLKNTEILKLFCLSCCYENDIFIKEQYMLTFIDAINSTLIELRNKDIIDDFLAISKLACPNDIIDDMSDEEELENMLVVESFEEEELQKKERAFKGGVYTIIPWINSQFKSYYPLKELLWEMLRSPSLSIFQRKVLFEIVAVLFSSEDEYKVSLPLPRAKKLVLKKLDENKVVIKREGTLKLHLNTKIKAPVQVKQLPVAEAEKEKVLSTVPEVKAEVKNTVKLNIKAVPKSVPKTKIRIKATAPTEIDSKKDTKPVAKVAKKVHKPTISRVGSLPLRFVKITDNKHVSLSSVPYSNNVEFLKVTRRTFQVKIKLKKSD
ncbi:Transcription initiation factor TFIID subunit 2 [Nakaseomyces bracarensis]|uniref:Transcription initiation factor TFIID subunit 2 n=1 Tax=Nakaseomyces bracarensis TaxID=273131 RepID=A0ABR4NPC8_9SACH